VATKTEVGLRLDEDTVRGTRERLGLTLAMVAQRAGTSKNTAMSAEHGADIRPTTARKIAEALGVEIVDLLGESDSPKKAAAPPSQPEERRALTAADLGAAETFSDVCNRLERFLDIADRKPLDDALLNMQHYLIRVAAGLSLPLMEKEAFRSLVLPTAARFVELARRFEEQRESGAADTEEETAQRRELVRELTRRISEAA